MLLQRKKLAINPIPVINQVTDEDIREAYNKIKTEIEDLINTEMVLLRANEISGDGKQKNLEDETYKKN